MLERETCAARLRRGLALRGMTQQDLCNATGIPKSAMSQYCNGAFAPKRLRTSLIAQALNVSEAWLMGYDVPMERGAEAGAIPPGFEPLPQTVRIPLVGNIACGAPITAEENIEEYVEAPVERQADFALRCCGDSMTGAGIMDGDIVYIRKQEQVRNGEIAAVRIGDEATLKYVYWDGATLLLVPANKSMLPKSYSGPALADIHIEGKAVGFVHWF